MNKKTLKQKMGMLISTSSTKTKRETCQSKFHQIWLAPITHSEFGGLNIVLDCLCKQQQKMSKISRKTANFIKFGLHLKDYFKSGNFRGH